MVVKTFYPMACLYFCKKNNHPSIMKHLLLLGTFFSVLIACKNETKTPSTAPETVQAPTEAAKPPAPARKNIVFFGNSLTAAYGLSPEQGFVALTQKKVDALGLPYTCVNAGLSGETTADGKNRVDWVLKQPVDIFVLELGGNDALRGQPVAAAKKNLQAIIDKVKARYPNCKIVLAGMLAPPNLGATYTNAFRDMYPAIAKNTGATLLPFLLEGVGGDPKLNQADGIHPTAAGNKIVVETVWNTLKKIL